MNRRKKLKTPSIELAKQQKGLANKMQTLVYAEDRTGEILWNIIAPTLRYSAQLNGEIADDIVAIDNAMKWGFGWQQGPFEIWDAIGVVKSVEKMKEEGKLSRPSFSNYSLKAMKLSIEKKTAIFIILMGKNTSRFRSMRK